MANDDLTLDQIGEQHDDMVDGIFDLSRRHYFTDQQQAAAFQADCVKTVLSKYGVHITASTPGDVADRMMERQKIKVEPHDWGYPGLYIYADDELVAYVSVAVPHKSDVIFHKPDYLVRTNVRC